MKSLKVREEWCLYNLNYSPMHIYYDTVSNYVLMLFFHQILPASITEWMGLPR